MTVHPVTWIDGVQVSAVELRQALNGLLVSGSAPLGVDGGVRYTDGTDLAVDRGTSGLKARVQPGTCLVPGSESTTQGGYGLWNDATLQVDLTAASSANPRTDLIVARVVDTGTDTSTYTIESVTGDAQTAGAPVPATPDNSLVLSRVYVPVNATLAMLQFTDMRTWLRFPTAPVEPAWVNVELLGGAQDGGAGQSIHRVRAIPETGQVELQFDVDTGGASGTIGSLPSFARPTVSRLRFHPATPSSSSTLNTHVDLTSDGQIQLYTQNPNNLGWLGLNVTYTP